MNSSTPSPTRPRWGVVIAVAVASMIVATLLDGWAYRTLSAPHVYQHDFGLMLRMAGYLPTWIVVSAGLLLCDAGFDAGASAAERAWRWRGVLPVASAAASGIAGELLKLVIRRERPWAHAGAYVFRSFADRPFYSGGLAMPSSHTVVVFGAAAMLARMYPRGRWLWYALAVACGVTRVLAHAHFVSDVTLGAIVAWLVAYVMYRWYVRHTMGGMDPTGAGDGGPLTTGR